MFRGRRLALVPVLAVLGGLVSLGAVLPSTGVAKPAARTARLAVGVEVMHFTADGRGATATGIVTARLSRGNVSRTVRERVAVIAAARHRCNILTLYLKQLNLSLLGLNVNVSKVNLTLTGNPHGGVLGSLFCKLANARVKVARASAARAINVQLRRRREHFVRFTTDIRAKAASAAGQTCQVLNLVLGPLNLNLLGLDVALNQVKLNITATNGAGVLGNLFCSLANNNTTTTSTTSTTSTTP